MKRTLTILFVLLSMSSFAQQEAVYSQYMFNGLALNPAYAGSRGMLTIEGLYRDQWAGIEGSPKTQTLTVHSPLKNEKISIGLQLFRDQISIFEQLGVFGSYAYRTELGSGKFSIGLQAGFSTYNAKWNELDLRNQGDGSFSDTDPNLLLPNVGIGLWYFTKKYYAGISSPRLLQNEMNYSSSSVANQKSAHEFRHYFITAGYLFELNQVFKLKPSILWKTVKSGGSQLDINANLIILDKLWTGLSYRTGGSMVFLVEYQINDQFAAGYSYDLLTNKFSKYARASHELMIRYEFGFDKNKVISPRYF